MGGGVEEQRSPEQLKQFKEGIKSINTPYGHQDVMAIKMMAVPDDVLRTYDDRGWTLFESNIINGKEPAEEELTKMGNLSTLNTISFDKTFDPKGEPSTGLKFVTKFATNEHIDPPLTPDRFLEEMKIRQKRAETKGVTLFTDGGDKPFIIDKYKQSYSLLSQAEALRFMHLDWVDADVKELCNALPDFLNLEELNLKDDEITDDGAAVLIKTLACRAKGKDGQQAQPLKKLILTGNPISDTMKDKMRDFAAVVIN